MYSPMGEDRFNVLILLHEKKDIIPGIGIIIDDHVLKELRKILLVNPLS